MSEIVATGAYVPSNIVTNDYFGKPNDTDKLTAIEKYMTGMRQRRHASDKETGISMAFHASKRAIENSSFSPKDIDLVIGNIAPNEYLLPEDLNLVSGELGCVNASVIPINTACSSFLTALFVANTMIEQRAKKVVLVVCSTNWVNHMIDREHDYSMFGDGAGALILTAGSRSLMAVKEASDQRVFHTMCMSSPVFTRKKEAFKITQDPKIDMDKQQVLKPIEVAVQLVNNQKVKPDWFISHQAGIGMLEYWLDQIELDKNKLRHTFDLYANMMAANIPVTLDHWITKGDIKKRDIILFFSPAAGAHYISILWRY